MERDPGRGQDGQNDLNRWEGPLKIFTADGTRIRPFGITSTLFLTVILVVALVHQPSGPVQRDLVLRPASLSTFSFTQFENCIMEKINKIRARRGLVTLRKDKDLGYVARLHARKIARAERLFHITDIADLGALFTGWMRLGENTGVGVSCRFVVRSWMNHQVHKENILFKGWRRQGVGVKKRDGMYYVEHIFSQGGDPAITNLVP